MSRSHDHHVCTILNKVTWPICMYNLCVGHMTNIYCLKQVTWPMYTMYNQVTWPMCAQSMSHDQCICFHGKDQLEAQWVCDSWCPLYSFITCSPVTPVPRKHRTTPSCLPQLSHPYNHQTKTNTSSLKTSPFPSFGSSKLL